MSEATNAGLWHVHGRYYLGNHVAARALVEPGTFCCVVNCAPDEVMYDVPKDGGVVVVRLPTVDIDAKALSELAVTVDAAVRRKGDGAKVLVHCMAGKVRSPTVLRVLLGVLEGISDEKASKLIVTARGEGEVGFLSVARRLSKLVPEARKAVETHRHSEGH